MKTTTALILLTTLQLTAAISYSQNARVSIKIENGTIADVFQEIEKQSTYTIFYKDNHLDVSNRVNLKAQNRPLDEVLTETLRATNSTFKVLDKIIVIAPTDSLQQKMIRGKVTDAEGSPLPGVSIIVKGTRVGTITDMDGKFELTLPTNAQVLVFSFMGMQTQEFEIGSTDLFNVVLKEDIIGMDELVVIGYGTQRRINLTGAVSSIQSEDLIKRQVGQSSMLLQGMAPGVTVIQRSGQPGRDGGSIRIRGIGTLSDANPLVLVDGIEMSINNIDPQLIESISVLKDAASASIYGSRAANGVILVTTKRGKANEPSFSYSGYVNMQNPTNLPDKVNAMDHMMLLDEAYTNSGLTPIYTSLIEEYKQFAESDPDKYPDTDWQKELLKPGFSENHFLNFNAGTENSKILGSIGYLNQDGIFDNTGFKRYSIRINSDLRVTKNITTRLDVFFQQANIVEPSAGINEIVFQMNRIPSNMPGVLSSGLYGEGWNGRNPIAWVQDGGTAASNVRNAQVNFSIEYQPFDWLTLDALVAPSLGSNHNKSFLKATDTYFSDGSFYMSYPAITNLRETQTNSTSNTLKTSILLDRGFDNHNFKLLLGFSQEDYTFNNLSAYREVFILPAYDVLDAGGVSNKDNSGTGGGWSLMSYFGRFNYDYLSKYLFEANARYDGSSRFAEGNKYSFFPSVSVGWRLSEELFLSNAKNWLNNMKLRASWGQLGNQNIGGSYYPFATYMSLTDPYSFGNTLVTGARLKDMSNPNLSWETTEMYNAGIDISLFHGLNITADVYSRTTTGILLQLDIPGITGLTAPFQNAGVVTNKGWELEANYRNKIGDLEYRIGGNISDVINRVVDLRGISRTTLTQSREGYPINSIYGLVALGLFADDEDVANSAKQGISAYGPGDIKYKNINDDDIINLDDQQIIGSTIPRYTYSFNAALNYKNFDFYMFWQGVGKADGYLNSSGIMQFFNGGTVFEIHKDRWTNDNQNVNATFPRNTILLSNNLTNSSFWLKDASYLRLKNIQLGYNLSKPVVQKIGISNLRLYITGQNLFTFDKFWPGYDVEAPIGSGNHYPQVKTYSFGVDVRF